MAAEEEDSRNGGSGDWRGLISSPRGGFLSEPFASKTYSHLLSSRNGEPNTVVNSEKVLGEACGYGRGSVGSNVYTEHSRHSNAPPRGRNGGSIAERRAAWCGTPRINTALFRSNSPLSSPSARSTYITIPPGLSPTTLLDSPVMLHNSQALPSPTTGTYPLPSLGHESSVPISASSNSEKDKCEDVDSTFMFQSLYSVPLLCFSGTENQTQDVDMTDANNQALTQLPPEKDYSHPAGFLKQPMTKNYTTSSPLNIEVANNTNTKCIPLQTFQPSVANDKAPQHEEQVHGEDVMSQQIFEGDQKGAHLSAGMGRPSEDGYNWRKYGQKQVKGSEYPRSYYKCTHPNCPVKKKIERSHDGQITEIIYKGAHKGAHNHPKPQPSRRSALGPAFSLNEMSEMGDVPGSYLNNEGGSVWRNLPLGSKDNKGCSDWRTDGLERTSSTSVVTELSDQLSTAQAKHLGILESADTPELSSTLASHDEDEDRATQGSVSLGDDADDVESESKRRKKESCLIETNLASRAVREPRVVVQTDSEVDILDDGYRWRKYGQKVVKGNPNPRSYYKCTSAGCSVRKHVERASHDLKYVITTYEGKHNHEVPAARNSSHVNSSAGNQTANNSNAQNSLTLPRSSNIPKLEAQVQDLESLFKRKPEFRKPNNLGGFVRDVKFGSAACYGMKLQSFPPSLPCGSFGLNPNPNEAHHRTSITQVFPELPMSFPLNFPLSQNLEMTSYDFNNHGKTVVPVSFLGAQQPKEDDMRFLKPKQELNDDAVFDTNNLFNGGFTL